MIFYSDSFRFLCPQHTIGTDEDERYGEQLSHVEKHVGLPGFLHVLGVFNEEAEDEDIGQTESEIPARSHAWLAGLLASFVDSPHDEEQRGVGDGLVELSGMARKVVDAEEDECPGHVGHLADNLAVHQIAQADKAGRAARGNGNIVEHGPDAYLAIAHIKPKGDDKAERSAVTGQSLVACEFPSAVGQEMNGNEHLEDVFSAAKEIVGLIEQAMPQSGTNQDA